MDCFITNSADIVFEEFSLILTTVGPFEDPVAVLQTIEVHTLVDTPVVPGLLPEAALDIVLPIPIVGGPIGVLESALALSLVINPVSEVNVALGVDESPDAIALISFPVAFNQLVTKTPYPRRCFHPARPGCRSRVSAPC